MPGLVALVVALIALVAPAADAQAPGPAAGEPPRLDPVVVTPGRFQQHAGDAPASVTVIGGEDIRRSPSQTVDDLLRQVPSFSLFRRSSSLVTHPTAQGVSLRGIGPSGASRALVLVDGIPLNDPFGGWVPWSRIPMLSIEQIEIVRGGGSALWGNGALGGVIQVITRHPRQRTIAAEGSHGSFDTTNVDLFYGDGHGPLRVALSGNWFETGGHTIVRRSRGGPIDIDADSTHGVFNGRLEFTPMKDVTVFLTGNSFDEERQNGTRIQANDTRARSLATGVNVHTPDGSDWQASVYWQRQMFHSTFSGQTADRTREFIALDQRSPSASVGGALGWTRKFGAHTWLGGVDGRWIEGETDEEVYSGTTGAFLRTRRAGGEQFFGGAYVQDSIAVTKALEVVVGIRGDYFSSFNGRRKEVPPAAGTPARQQFSDIEHWLASPRLGALFRATPTTDVQAAIYQGWRGPTLNELYRVFRVRNDVTVANEHLEPERLTGGELGVRQRWGIFDGRLTAFWNQVQDQVLNVSTPTPLFDCPAGTTCRQRRNVELTRIRGLEGEAEAKPTRDLRITAAHLYSGAKVLASDAQPVLEGKRLAQVPRHVTTLGVRWERPEWASVGVTARFVGGQFEDDLNTLPMGRYTVLDARLSRTLGPWAPWGTVFFAVENLTDETYAVARTGEGVVSVGTPRLFRGGVRFTF
jgi:outer membrane receptor protein involved in Fe transport